MKLLQKMEFKRPDQIMEVYQGEEQIFFIYSHRGMEKVVFTNPHKATEYADSPLTFTGEADFRVTLDDEAVQNVPTDQRQGTMLHLALEWCVNNDINTNLINPYK